MAPVTKKRPLKLIYGELLSLMIVTLLLRYWYQDPNAWSDWIVMLPVVQTVFASIVSLRYRHSRSVHVHNLIATVAIWSLSATMFLGVFDLIILYFLDVAVHIALPVGWLFAAGGVLAVPFCLRRRWHLPLKFWLLIVSGLLTAESSVRLLAASNDSPLEFPGEFPRPPRDEIHVAAIGGSSTLGYPYQPKFGFPQVTAWRIQQLYPNRTVVLHNLAKGGLNLRQAAQELNELKYRPHVLLIYSGHNEFYHNLEEFAQEEQSRLNSFDSWIGWSALFRVSNRYVSRLKALRESRGGRRLLIDRPIASPALYAARLNRFRSQCEQLNAFCRRQGIAPIWFIPAASESGFEPNRSGNRILMSSEVQAEIHKTAQQVQDLENDEVIKLYRRTLKRVPGFAEFHFRLAECLQRAGDLAGARLHFAEALDTDGHPLRANRDYREIVRQSAQLANVPLVETSEYLRPHARDNILGKSLFLDNVHMTLRGYYLTGLAGCETIIESGALKQEFGPPANVDPLSLTEAIERSGLTSDDLARAYRRTAFGLFELGEWRFDRTVRHREADRFLHMAEALENREINPGEEGTESLKPD